MSRSVELVVFDMAGTTVSDRGDVVNRCLREALARAGLAVRADAVNAAMGLSKRDAIRQLVDAAPPAGRACLAGAVESIHADFVARMRDHYLRDEGVEEVAGASATFRRLRAAGLRVALDTGFPRAVADAVLQRLGWDGGELVDASCASDEVARARPHGDMIHALMRRLGIADPERVAKVGDAPADLLEGVDAGCGLVVGVTGGTHTRAELARHPHTHLIASVAELPALLGL